MQDEAFDVAVIGCGPAGMAGALRATALGLRVVVLDDQARPGGQIWRNVECVASEGLTEALGREYAAGLGRVEQFRRSGAHYLPRTVVWHVEPGFRILALHEGKVRALRSRTLLLATGAFERPVPFPGWTLPGVLTIGAAQILLKSAHEIPAEPVWLAGCGPLLLLYATQLLAAGGQIAGILDTQTPGSTRRALGQALGGIRAWRDVLKAAGWSARLRNVPVVRGVVEVEALGSAAIEAVRYRTAGGNGATVPTKLLLVHEGVIPDVQLTHALGCRHRWVEAQQCFAPVLDASGETTVRGCFVAGDGGGIGGSQAAVVAGELAGYALARAAGRPSAPADSASVEELRRRLDHALALRPLLDTMFAPRAALLTPADETVVCRCEDVTAGTLRAAVAAGCRDPNQLKASTRCGMGPCLGRQCGAVAAALIAQATGDALDRVGLPRVRPPLRPVTLAQLAQLAQVCA